MLKSLFKGLSDGIKYVQMICIMPMKLTCKFENSLFFLYFFNNDFSLNIQCILLRLNTHVHDDHWEGIMSQIFDLGLSFCFMQSGKKKFKKMTKSYPFF